MPLTFSLYIAKHFSICFIIVLCIVTGTILLFDILELIKILYAKNVGFITILKMSCLRNFLHVQKVLPFIILIASILTYARLNKSFETIAARSAGISVWQIILPAVATNILLGVLYFSVITPFSAFFIAKYEKLEAQYIKGQANMMALSKTGLWLKQIDKDGQKSIIHALRTIQKHQELFDVTIYFLNKDGKFEKRIDAENVTLKDDYWEVHKAKTVTNSHTISEHDIIKVPTNLTFNMIQESMISPETLSFWKLPLFISIAEESGFSALRHKLHFYKLLISPIFFASMVIIGAAFCFSMPRSNKTARHIIYGLITGFLIYFLSDLIFAMGIAGNIPVIIASIIPTSITLSIGIILQLYKQSNLTISKSH